jgi:hypothetical protein
MPEGGISKPAARVPVPELPPAMKRETYDFAAKVSLSLTSVGFGLRVGLSFTRLRRKSAMAWLAPAL